MLSTDQTLKLYNFAITQPIFKQKKLAWFIECVDYQNKKITCSKNALGLQNTKLSCSEYFMKYSIFKILFTNFKNSALYCFSITALNLHHRVISIYELKCMMAEAASDQSSFPVKMCSIGVTTTVYALQSTNLTRWHFFRTSTKIRELEKIHLWLYWMSNIFWPAPPQYVLMELARAFNHQCYVLE